MIHKHKYNKIEIATCLGDKIYINLEDKEDVWIRVNGI